MRVNQGMARSQAWAGVLSTLASATSSQLPPPTPPLHRPRCLPLPCRLAELGVEPDTPVGILLDRCFDLVVAILATLKVGCLYGWACYLPLA